MIPANSPAYILGYHGCDSKVAENVLSGKSHLVSSTNNYDWLGHGIYFWEDNPKRAELWAEQRMEMPGSTIEKPAVVGAILDLRLCFSLMRADHIEILRATYEGLKNSLQGTDFELPSNTGGDDRFLRRLDCAVIQTLHKFRGSQDLAPIDSVRGLFQEGDAVYPGASFREGNHVQICIRNFSCIKGYFRPF